MFVKIKYEPGSGKPNIFALDDNATIHDLKIKMESIIEIPAESQEIHTLSSLLDNVVVLSTMVQQNNNSANNNVAKTDNGVGINGAAISLYSGQKFICFLQLYNETEGDIQGNFFDQEKTSKLLPIDQVPQYFETIETDDSCPSTNTSSSDRSCYSSDTSEGSGSDNETRASLTRKRKSAEDAKVPTPPKRRCGATVVPKTPETKSPIERPSPKISAVDNPKKSPITKCPDSENYPPYVSVSPEHRQFILIITTDSTKKDFSALMSHFYVLFETSKNCDRFSFSEKDSVAEFNEKLWLTCGDRITCDWITQSFHSLKEYKSYEYIEYFHLKRCSVILPEVVKNKKFFSIFQLLELQNCGLRTDKWCVVERKPLLGTSQDYKEKVVTHICQNEEITLWIDGESVEFMQKNDFKLKYCFWSLSFILS